MRASHLCLAAGLLFVLPVPAEANRFTAQRPFPMINVTGEGQVTVVPDLAEVSAGVATEAKTSREAAEANGLAMAAVVEAARGAGIAERDIRTSRFAIEPVHRAPARNAPPQIVGYRATNIVRLRLRDIAAVGEVLDKLTAAGATNISALQFSRSDLDRVADEARAAAYANARRKAETYAKAAGAQVGRAIKISEGEAHLPRPMAMRAAVAESAAPPILSGEERVTVTVTVAFELLH